MNRARTEGNRMWPNPKPQAQAAIVFGSTITEPSTRSANVRETCETIGLARSTYYYQSRRSASATELEHRIVLRLHELRQRFPKDGYRRMTELLLAEGFSVKTCLPALAASTICAACCRCGVASTTASISRSASSFS